MKQIYSIIFATLMALFLLPACSEDIYNEYYYDPSLEEGLSFSFTPGDMTFYKSGGDITATIQTPKHWVVILRADWLSVSKNSGDGDAELTFTASPLPEGEGNRYSEIEIFISDGRTQRSYRYNVEQTEYELLAGSIDEDFGNGIPSNWQVLHYPYETKSTQIASDWISSEIAGRSAAKAYVESSYTSVINECESWLVTPAINNEYGDLYLSFDSFAQLTGNNQENAKFEVYLLNGNNPAYADRVQLNPTLPKPVSVYDTDKQWTNSGTIKLDQLTGTVYIGFKYSPNVGATFYNSTEWFITNVWISQLEAPVQPDNPLGLGTSENPYNISYVNSSTEDLTDVWVAGYVVGYVDGMTFDNGAIFAAGDVRTNIILSENQEEYSIICPAQLPAGSIRDNLNLSDNPYMLGGYIQVRCDISTYFGRRGIKNITEWVWATPPSSRAKTRR